MRENGAKSGQVAGYPWSRERVLGKLLKENNSYGGGREAVLVEDRTRIGWFEQRFKEDGGLRWEESLVSSLKITDIPRVLWN